MSSSGSPTSATGGLPERVKLLAEDIKPHDRIYMDRAWWQVVSTAPAVEGFVRVLVTRGGVRLRLSLAVGQQWVAERPPRRRGLR